MPKAEYRNALRSRRLINEAVAQLMQEKPLDKITVTDVVKRADINRGTFYAHYADVPDVLAQQMEVACGVLRAALADCGPDLNTSSAAFVLHKLQDSFAENRAFFTALLSSGMARSATERLRDVFIEYMMAHRPKGVDPEQFLFVMRFASGGVSSMYCDWVTGKLPLTLDQLTEKAITVVQNMGAALQG